MAKLQEEKRGETERARSRDVKEDTTTSAGTLNSEMVKATNQQDSAEEGQGTNTQEDANMDGPSTAGDTATVWNGLGKDQAITNYAAKPDRDAQPAAGSDAALGSGFNTCGKPNNGQLVA